MKKSILFLAITMMIAGTITTSCDTPEKKEEAAREDVNEAKEDLKEAQAEANANAMKVANAEEWKAYKDETEIKIKANEVRIAELKRLKQKPGKVFDKMFESNIETLEKRNADLRAKLIGYESSQSDWEAFKREFNSDMDGIKKSLEDLSVDNKK
jgi:hypothetical protein